MENKRILVVGGVAGGASAAARARRLDENAEIIMFEKGPHISFSNCALPFYLSGIVENAESLVLMQAEAFWKQRRIDARPNHEVLSIDRANKTIAVKNLENSEIKNEAYDVLILSPGAFPIKPRSIKGIERENVYTLRNVEDIVNIKKAADKAEEIAVIGGGFIGIEVAENLIKAGKKVHLIEMMDQVMTPFDYDMAQILHRELHKNGVDLILSDALESIEEDKVSLCSGKEVPADMVVMAIGVAPENNLAKEAGLETGLRGGIKVNHNYQTSDPNIYAVGDAIESHCFFDGKPSYLSMAGAAQREARAAVDHIYGRPTRNKGVICSSVIKIFDLNAASTGLNEKQLQEKDIPYDYSLVIPQDHVALIPGATPLFTKVLFAVPSGQLMGAQVIGKGDAAKRADVMAAMISMHANLEDLKNLELCYSPFYNNAKDPLNQAALVGLNILNREIEHVHVCDIRSLVEDGAFIIDAREEKEYAQAHIKTAVNIPLSQFRDRLDEIPKDKTVYVHCLSSQRAYYMCRALNQLGYHAVMMDGSLLMLSEYEYFLDETTDRETIITNYILK